MIASNGHLFRWIMDLWPSSFQIAIIIIQVCVILFGLILVAAFIWRVLLEPILIKRK